MSEAMYILYLHWSEVLVLCLNLMISFITHMIGVPLEGWVSRVSNAAASTGNRSNLSPSSCSNLRIRFALNSMPGSGRNVSRAEHGIAAVVQKKKALHSHRRNMTLEY